MARDHARIYLSIWDDPAFVNLTAVQQLVYLQHVSHKDLSWCGVLPYLPERLVALTKDLTRPKVAAAIDALERARFLVVDRKTAETLVRTYVRHDGILKQPNVTIAMTRALGKVHSAKLVNAVEREIVRLLRDDPDARGWQGFGKDDPERFARLFAKAYPNP